MARKPAARPPAPPQTAKTVANTLALFIHWVRQAASVLQLDHSRSRFSTLEALREAEPPEMPEMVASFGPLIEQATAQCAAFIELLDSGAMKVLPEPLWLELRRRLRHMRNPQLPLIALWVKNAELAFLKNTKDDVRRALDGFAETVAWLEHLPGALDDAEVSRRGRDAPGTGDDSTVAYDVRIAVGARIDTAPPADSDPDDLTLAAREYLDGLEFRYSETERARHLPGTTPAKVRSMYRWADAPARDRRVKALDALLNRVREHPRPPYSPEVLLKEHRDLWAIAREDRLAERFFERAGAWLDRVGAFLGTEGESEASAPRPSTVASHTPMMRPVPVAKAAEPAGKRPDVLLKMLRTRGFPIGGEKRTYFAELDHVVRTVPKRRRAIEKWADEKYPAR